MKNFKTIVIVSTLFFLAVSTSTAQKFLNGDFENTTAPTGIDQINLPNQSFNAMMANNFAFGTYGDMDIINTSNYSGAAQHGSWFVAFTGGGTDAISMELSSAMVAGKSYSITFWDKASTGFVTQAFQIGVSTEKDILGTVVYTGQPPVIGVWSKRSFRFVAPVSGKYITVQLAGISDISHWAQADNFSITASEFEILTKKTAIDTYCSCSEMKIGFSAKGIFAEDNIFTVQLSDENGSFENPTIIGNLNTNANTGEVICHIPCDIISSPTYRVRVTSSLPEVIGSDNGSDIMINGIMPFDAKIVASPGNLIVEGSLVTFNLISENNRIATKYQWLVNGQIAGELPSFTSKNLKNGDIVSLMVSIENSCSFSHIISSNEIVMNVIVPVKPLVSIEALGSETLHKGKSLTFVATAENGGTKPKYQWKINGENVGGDSEVFTFKNFNDGDKVSVEMTPNEYGMSKRTVFSNTIMVSIIEPLQADKDKLDQQKKNDD